MSNVSEAIESQGTLLEIGQGDATTVLPGADVFDEWGSVTNITGVGSGEAPDIDVTVLRSTAREFLTGLADGGTVNISFFRAASNTGQQSAYAAWKARQRRNFKVTWSDGTVTSFAGSVKSFGRDATVDGAVQGSASIRISGEETEA